MMDNDYYTPEDNNIEENVARNSYVENDTQVDIIDENNDNVNFVDSNIVEDNFIDENINNIYQTQQETTQFNKKPKNPWKIIVIVLLCAAVVVGGYFGIRALLNNDSEDSEDVETVNDEYVQVENTTIGNYSSENSLDVSGLVEATMPSLVSITNTSVTETQNIYNYFYGGNTQQESTSLGSGVIIGENDTELLIVTNAHVVEDATTLTVTTCDEQSFEANVKGCDSDVDIAVIAVKLENIPTDTLNTIKIASFGDSDAAKIGEQVVAIGNAAGIGQSVTTGIISALNRTISTSTTGLIQTDAAINPGNSGGALFNMNGELIGINNSKFVDTTLEGMGFAIPSSSVKPLVEEFMTLETREKVADDEQGVLGITGQSVTVQVDDETSKEGVYITSISSGGGVDEAGIPLQSIIIKINGTSVSTVSEIKNILQYYKVGETVEVTCLVVDGKEYVEKTYEVTLGEESDTSSNSQTGNSYNGNSGNSFNFFGY